VTVANALDVKVRWSEADPAGIVFYPRFFEWFDLGTEALFESLGLPWAELFPASQIVGVPIVESGARFASPVRFGDLVRIQTTVEEVRGEDLPRRTRYPSAAALRHRLRRCAWVAQPESPGGTLAARPIPPRVATRLRGEPAP
jgi:4-hydroxybenzoyl-CoA thioesterase